MAKTIKQLADELNIDKQRVYRYIKKNHINESHQINGVMYYDEAEEYMITKGFSQNSVSYEAHQNHINEVINDVVVEALMKQLDVQENMLATLENQLSVKDSQISNLQEQLHTKDIQIEQLQSEISMEHHHSREQSDKLAQLAENAQQLQKGQMVMNIDNSKMIADKVTEPKGEMSNNHWWSNLFKKDKNNL